MPTNEPKPSTRPPNCPTWLPPAARDVWDRTMGTLREMDVLGFVDGDALAAYCQVYARWIALEDFINKNGEVYPIRGDDGKVLRITKLPQVNIARDLLATVRLYQQEFGMTPSSRTRVSTIGNDGEDDDDERFFGPKPVPNLPKTKAKK